MINIYELLRRNQDGTSEYVINLLKEMNIDFQVDSYGNIYYLDNENVPLLSAHMDTVRKEEDFCIGAFLTESEDDKIFSGGILGGDDKCGVYIILKVLESGRKVNFIFSRDEEIGCLGIKALLKPKYVENKELTEKIKNNCLYCLVLDRKHNHDIICTQNWYGSEEFEKALEKVSDDGNFGYKGARGLCSDANTIRDYISTANLSVGYHEPHSQKEYVSKKDLQKALDYTNAIIDNLKDKFEASEYYTPSFSSSYYNRNYNYYDYDYDYGYGRYDYYNNSSNANNKETGPSEKDNDFDDDSYSEYWQGWGTYDPSKRKKCHFCNFSSDLLLDFELPYGNKVSICEFCLEDLEIEVKRVKALMYK